MKSVWACRGLRAGNEKIESAVVRIKCRRFRGKVVSTGFVKSRMKVAGAGVMRWGDAKHHKDATSAGTAGLGVDGRRASTARRPMGLADEYRR